MVTYSFSAIWLIQRFLELLQYNLITKTQSNQRKFLEMHNITYIMIIVQIYAYGLVS